MNPKIKIGKLRNRRTGKQYIFNDVRSTYDWKKTQTFKADGDKYRIYRYSKQGSRPIPKSSDIGLMKPPFWEGNLKESPVKFYSRENGEPVRDIEKAAAGLYEEWGEGIYQVQRYPDVHVPTIQNLFKPALIRKIR